MSHVWFSIKQVLNVVYFFLKVMSRKYLQMLNTISNLSFLVFGLLCNCPWKNALEILAAFLIYRHLTLMATETVIP